jgi:hypothetical protein
MIILLRVYKDGRVIAAEAYDHDETPFIPPHLRCRCIPSPTWRVRESELARELDHDKITVTPIYLPDKE